jgi:hypothetical protein
MKNKAHFVNILCNLRNWTDPESPEVKKLYEMKIVDLLLAIKNETSSESDDNVSLAEILGCSH